MLWIVKYRKPLALATACGVLFWLWQADRAAQYESGYLKAQTEYRLEAARAHAGQAAAVLERERRAAADLAAKQAEIEKERTHAETVITGLRADLGRLRDYAGRQGGGGNLPATPAAPGAPDEAAARGWQLFGRCAERYAGVAEIADRQRNDLAEWQAYGRAVQGVAAEQ